MPIQNLPIILQCNKQDLLGALPPPHIKHILHLAAVPAIPAVARQGEGVFDTLKAITRGVIASVQHQAAFA